MGDVSKFGAACPPWAVYGLTPRGRVIPKRREIFVLPIRRAYADTLPEAWDVQKID